MIDKIRDRESFTPTESQIAGFIRDNSREVVNMSLDDLAEKLYVSKSTIIRFCKKLGVSGHKELCVELAKELTTFAGTSRTPSSSSLPFEHYDDRKVIADKLVTLHYRALNDTFQDLNVEAVYRIAKEIREKKNVYVYALEGTYLTALDFETKLQSIGYVTNGTILPGMVLQRAAVQPPESIALIISYYANEQAMIQAAKILNSRKIPVMLIRGPFHGTLEKFADEIAEAGFLEDLPKIGSLGSRTSVLLVLDLLFLYIFNMDYEKNLALVKMSGETRSLTESPENGRISTK